MGGGIYVGIYERGIYEFLYICNVFFTSLSSSSYVVITTIIMTTLSVRARNYAYVSKVVVTHCDVGVISLTTQKKSSSR